MLIVMLTPEVCSSQSIIYKKKIPTTLPAMPVKISNIFTGRECLGGTRLDLKDKCRIVSSLLNMNRSILVLNSFHLKVDKGWAQT